MNTLTDYLVTAADTDGLTREFGFGTLVAETGLRVGDLVIEDLDHPKAATAAWTFCI
ncbi:hypothetical protein [Krasilnikovia sp. MM14-A1259]|uniref:hypothetical protein n=1 Tax=Krasilnikovia sp. MM14-A1259 TaxID=3373539 RepID=UPI0038278956